MAPGSDAAFKGRFSKLVAGAAIFTASMPPAAVADTGNDERPPPSIVQRVWSEPVETTIGTNLWALDFQTKDRFGSQPISENIDLGTIVRNLRSIALGTIEVKKGPVFLMGDLVYASIGLHPKFLAAIDGSVKLTGAWTTVAAGYALEPVTVARVNDQPITLRAAPFAGASYVNIDVVARSEFGGLAKVAQDWWRPTVGARFDVAYGRYSLRLEGATGTFIGSKIGNQGAASLGYTFDCPEWGSPTVRIGYRYLFEKRKYNDDRDVISTTLKAPVVSLSSTFLTY